MMIGPFGLFLLDLYEHQFSFIASEYFARRVMELLLQFRNPHQHVKDSPDLALKPSFDSLLKAEKDKKEEAADIPGVSRYSRLSQLQSSYQKQAS